MERGYWVRLLAVLGLVLGSVWALMPSILGDDSAADVVAASTQKVEKEPSLAVWLQAADGTADEATVTAAAARIEAAGFAVDGVQAEAGRVEVTVRAGVDKEAVASLLLSPGEVALFGADAVEGGKLPAAADPEANAALDADKPAAGAVPLALTWSGFDVATGTVRVTGSLPKAGALVALDGSLVARVDAKGALTPLASDAARQAVVRAALAGPKLPEALSRYVAPAADPTASRDPSKAEEAATGWKAFLPAAKLNLGLDLQGGIDLTLQVDQDEAVFTKVARDRTALRDQAARDGLGLEIQRDRARPGLRFATADLPALKAWLTGVTREYEYEATVREDDVDLHVFRLAEAVDAQIRAQAVEQVLETLRKRVDSTGVKEPSIVQMPGGRINIQLPGVKDAQGAIDAIGTQAILEFRLVDDAFDYAQIEQAVAAAREALPGEQFLDDALVDEWLHDQGKLPDDRRLFWEYAESAETKVLERSTAIVLKEPVLLTGADVNNAVTNWGATQERTVDLEFKPQGASIFCDVTTNNVKKRFAILLDGQVRSAPQINEAICGGRAQITLGNSSIDADAEAQTLALVLRTGSLTAPVDIGEVREIGPSLGRDAIQSGVQASLIGGAFIGLFMLAWYRAAGVIAIIALSLNVLLVFASLAMFGATLTLPGIAGVALTVGMAVDANIIVYERIREELALGVSARKAVDTGFDKGAVAVLDGNLTTAVAGIVLYSYGTGPIKGFAVTLLVGIATTLITGVYVTRALLEMITRHSDAKLRI
jgi:preprotein translocase subunit SecD